MEHIIKRARPGSVFEAIAIEPETDASPLEYEDMAWTFEVAAIIKVGDEPHILAVKRMREGQPPSPVLFNSEGVSLHNYHGWQWELSSWVDDEAALFPVLETA